MIEKSPTRINEKSLNTDIKKLSIQVSLNGLSFCALNATNEIVQSDKVDFSAASSQFIVQKELEAFIDQNHLEEYASSEVTIIYNNLLFSIVPVPLFKENQIADYLKFNARIATNDIIVYDKIDTEDFVVVYTIFDTIHNFLSEKFKNISIKHSASLLIPSLLKLHKHSSGRIGYIHVSEREMQFLVISDGEFTFYNTFTHATKEDFLYFILFTLEQLEIHPNAIQLHLFGAIEESDELYTLCYEYIKNVSIFYPEIPYTLSEVLVSESLDYVVLNSF